MRDGAAGVCHAGCHALERVPEREWARMSPFGDVAGCQFDTLACGADIRRARAATTGAFAHSLAQRCGGSWRLRRGWGHETLRPGCAPRVRVLVLRLQDTHLVVQRVAFATVDDSLLPSLTRRSASVLLETHHQQS